LGEHTESCFAGSWLFHSAGAHAAAALAALNKERVHFCVLNFLSTVGYLRFQAFCLLCGALYQQARCGE